MRRLLRTTFVLAAALTLSLGIPAIARAETVRSERVALGWQTEHASAVLVGDVATDTERGASGGHEITLRVDVLIRGAREARSNATIVLPDLGHGSHLKIGTRVLAFLDPDPTAPAESPRFRLVSAEYGLRTISGDGPESRFADIVTQIAATLSPDGTVREADTLRALLVGWMEDADPGIAWSAATDFVRHAELHGGLTQPQSDRILAAYARCPIGKDTKPALAAALAATKHTAASAALVNTLLAPDAKSVRGSIAAALRRLGDPTTEARLCEKLAEADAPTQKTLLVALGTLGAADAVPAVRRCLADADVTVRVEAAHALGLIARTVRGADHEARVAGREDLEQIAAHPKSDDELRASLWALAQLDTPESWSALRAIAGDEKQSDLARRTATEFLARPRVSLILD